MAETPAVYSVQPNIAVFTPNQVELIKSQIAVGVTDDELRLFVSVAQKSGLDPFGPEPEIYAIVRSSKNRDGGYTKKMVIQISIAGLLKKVEATGLYGGMLGPYWCGVDGKWVDVWLKMESPAAAKVGIIRLDWKEPLWAVAKYTSYAQRGNDSNPTRFWQQMPDRMLALAAQRLGCRTAFPHETRGYAVEGETPLEAPSIYGADNPPLEVREPIKLSAATRAQLAETTGLISAEPLAEDELKDGEERTEYTNPEAEGTVPDVAESEEPRIEAEWPAYPPFTELPKVGTVPVTRQALTQWIAKREKQCDEAALRYPGLDPEMDDLGLANHWAQLKAILESAR